MTGLGRCILTTPLDLALLEKAYKEVSRILPGFNDAANTASMEVSCSFIASSESRRSCVSAPRKVAALYDIRQQSIRHEIPFRPFTDHKWHVWGWLAKPSPPEDEQFAEESFVVTVVFL